MAIDWLSKLGYTAGAAFIIAGCAFVAYTLMIRNETTHRRQLRARYRVIYLAVIVLLIVLVEIWIEHFTHLFTMLGLVAAGLVVANKETLMNVTGWLIINWRNLFAEGDHIALLTYSGYVDHLGLLYFKIYEVDPESNYLTGRTVRIPNGLVINNSVINYSASNQLSQTSIAVPLAFGADLTALQEVIQSVLQAVLLEHYRKLPLPETLIWRRYHKELSHLIAEEPLIRWQPQLDKKLVNVVVHFYCLAMDQLRIKNAFWRQLLLRAQTDENLKKALGGGKYETSDNVATAR